MLSFCVTIWYTTDMDHKPLAEWLNNYIGPGKGFPSARSLSEQAGLGHATVTNIRKTGRGDPLSLIVLADFLGTPRLEVFIKAGWLRPTDVFDLGEWQSKMVVDAESLPEDQREVLLSVLSQLVSPSSRTGASLQDQNSPEIQGLPSK